MSSSDDPLLGGELAGYRIESVVSHGKAFEIYRAEQSSVDRRVVLKVLARRHSENTELVAEFLRGAREAAKLGHPGIVRVYDALSENGRTFVSMELVEGLDLEKHVTRHGPFPRDRWLEILRQSCEALVHAESFGIVHTGLTPSHLLVTSSGTIKLLNLGIGLAIEPLRPPVGRRKLSIVRYFAPERIRTSPPTASADVYSLGCSLFFAMTGRSPFPGENLTEVLSRKDAGSCPAPTDERGRTVPEIANVLERMTSPEPADRHVDAQAVLADLDERLAKTAIVRARPATGPFRGRRRRRAAIALAAALVALLAARVLEILPFRSPVDRSEEHEGSPRSSSPEPTRSRSGSLESDSSSQAILELENALRRRAALGSPRTLENARTGAPSTEVIAGTPPDDPDRAPTRSVDDLTRRAADVVLTELRSTAALLNRRFQQVTKERAALKDAEISVYVLLEGDEVEAARRLLESIPTPEDQNSRSRHEELTRRLALYESTATEILRGAHAAAGDAAVTVEAPRLLSGAEEESRRALRIRAVRARESGEVELDLESNLGRLEGVRLVDLDPLSLFGLFRRGSPAHSNGRPEELEGFLVYLFARAGPVAAADFAEIIGDDARSMTSAREEIDRVGREILDRAVRGVETLAYLVADEETSRLEEAHWDGIRSAIGTLVERHGRRPYFAGFHDALAELYIRAAREEYRALGPVSLFHGEAVAKPSGQISVTYEFNSSTELDDFVLLRGTLTHEKGALVLNGECRLKHGDPFLRRLVLSSRVPEYDVTAPNINIAVWTRESDRVTSLPPAQNAITPENEHLGLRGGGKDLPNDYLAFGLGYRLAGRFLHAVGARGPVATMPAHAMLGGVRGAPLHLAHGDGVYFAYWAESVGNRLKGPQLISLAITPEKFVWSTRGTKLHIQAKRRKPRLLEWISRPEELGSITLFTNGHRVAFDFLSLEADLNPTWGPAELERRARGDFERLARKHGVSRQ